MFFSETSQPGTYIIRVEKFYRTYSPPPCCDRIFCRNSCEMWSETRWRYVNIYKGIQIKRNCQDIYYAHFPKPGILFRSFECLKSEEWNLLKTGLSKGNAYYPAFSCFTRWNCLGIFFLFKHICCCLVADFAVLEHLCNTSLYPINFKKTCHVEGSEKLTKIVNA